jgi:hypothetical protein
MGTVKGAGLGVPDRASAANGPRTWTVWFEIGEAAPPAPEAH